MSSSFGGINTVVRGLFASQAALDTVGHNVTNASTEGYSRQSVNTATALPETIYGLNGSMQKGTGVDMISITRARDTFVDRQVWKENSLLGYAQTKSDNLAKTEEVFREPSDTGVQTVLNQFWNSLQTLSTNAADSGGRTLVRENGVSLVDTIQHAAQQLKDMVGDLNAVMDINVDKINQITADVLSLNKQITNIEAGGLDNANDLRDRRDSLVDQLSSIININVTQDSVGNYLIQSGSNLLVDGTSVQRMATQSTVNAAYGFEVKVLVMEGTGAAVTATSGELKGVLDSRDSADFGAIGYLDKLSSMAQALLQDFNDVHRAGYGLNDSTGTNFFGADSATDYSAATLTKGGWLSALQVNPALFATGGTNLIAAKTTSSTDPTKPQGVAAGDNAILLGNALKTDLITNLGGSSLDTFYSSFIGGLGVQAQSATRLATNQTALVKQVLNWRSSVSGVSMDEEMTNMIKFQKGYNASARVMTTMDEMLDKLINGTGTVGR